MWVRKKSAPKLKGRNERKTGHDVLQWLMVLVTIIFLYQNLVSYRFGDVRHVQEWATSRVASILTGKQDAAPPSHVTSEMKQTTNKLNELIIAPRTQKRNRNDEETRLTRIVDGIMRSLMAERGWKGDEKSEADIRKAKSVVYL